MVSGICTAPWHPAAMAGLEMLCAAMAAVGFIALPAAVAPAYRVHVAVVCLIVGGILTTALAVAGALWAPAATAAITGVITISVVISRSRRGLRRRHTDTARETP